MAVGLGQRPSYLTQPPGAPRLLLLPREGLRKGRREGGAEEGRGGRTGRGVGLWFVVREKGREEEEGGGERPVGV